MYNKKYKRQSRQIIFMKKLHPNQVYVQIFFSMKRVHINKVTRR